MSDFTTVATVGEDSLDLAVNSGDGCRLEFLWGLTEVEVAASRLGHSLAAENGDELFLDAGADEGRIL